MSAACTAGEKEAEERNALSLWTCLTSCVAVCLCVMNGSSLAIMCCWDVSNVSMPLWRCVRSAALVDRCSVWRQLRSPRPSRRRRAHLLLYLGREHASLLLNRGNVRLDLRADRLQSPCVSRPGPTCRGAAARDAPRGRARPSRQSCSRTPCGAPTAPCCYP